MTLIEQADQAFAKGNLTAGLEALRAHSQSGHADAQSWNRLAIVEEQIGDWELAGRAHYHCVQFAPEHAPSYLYAGCWFAAKNKFDQAASMFSLAQDINPAVFVETATAAPAHAQRCLSAERLLRSFLSDQHRSINNHPTAHKVRDAIWVRTHDQDFDYQANQFKPELFYLNGVEHKEFYEAGNFDWSASLQASSSLVHEELTTMLKLDEFENQLRPYLADNSILEGELQELAGSRRWSAFDIYRNGQLNPNAEKWFPNTLAALDNIPCYGETENPYEVFFSVLKPHQSIAPHFGQSNHALTVHLGLVCPPKCFLKVGAMSREWTENELLIFDDSYLHSAHNVSNNLRIVLIFSVWHPSLTVDERKAIQTSFQTRRQWMEARSSKLTQLINQP